jgi:hypothetical protein
VRLSQADPTTDPNTINAGFSTAVSSAVVCETYKFTGTTASYNLDLFYEQSGNPPAALELMVIPAGSTVPPCV